MVNLRLMGARDEVESVKCDLKNKGINIIECTRPYLCRGSNHVRVYIKILPNGYTVQEEQIARKGQKVRTKC